MISNLILGCSVLLFVIAILELLMTDEQKASVGNRLTVLWNWLDEVKVRQKVASKRASKWLVSVAGVGAVLLMGFLFVADIFELITLPAIAWIDLSLS
ncbi:hypothetical protein [Bradyrhizobium sp.]